MMGQSKFIGQGSHLNGLSVWRYPTQRRREAAPGEFPEDIYAWNRLTFPKDAPIEQMVFGKHPYGSPVASTYWTEPCRPMPFISRGGGVWGIVDGLGPPTIPAADLPPMWRYMTPEEASMWLSFGELVIRIGGVLAR